MKLCRMCQYGVETFDRQGYRIVRCEARKADKKPWWYREGEDPPERTPTFPYLAAPECDAYELGKRFQDEGGK